MLSLKGTTCALILALLVVVSGRALATELPRTVDDLLAMTDEEAIAFAEKASPNKELAASARAWPNTELPARARVWRYTAAGGLKLARAGEGPWNLIAGVPGDLGPLMLDEVGMQWLRARLADQKPNLTKPGLGFVWAGNRITDPKTGEWKRDVPPSLMVIWPFSREATGLPGGVQTPTWEVRIMLPDSPYAHLIVPVPGVKGLYGSNAHGQRGDVEFAQSKFMSPVKRSFVPGSEPFIVAAALSRKTPVAGETAEITAEIRSQTSPHARTTITFFVDGREVDQLSGVLIPPFQTATVVFAWTAVEGTHALRIELASAAGVVLTTWEGTVDVPVK